MCVYTCIFVLEIPCENTCHIKCYQYCIHFKSKWHTVSPIYRPIQQHNVLFSHCFHTLAQWNIYKKKLHITSKSGITEMRSHSNEFIHLGSQGAGIYPSMQCVKCRLCPQKATGQRQIIHSRNRNAISSELHVEHRRIKEYATSTHAVGLGSNRWPSCHDVIYHASQIHVKCYQLFIIKHARRLCLSCTNFFYFLCLICLSRLILWQCVGPFCPLMWI